MVVRQRNDVLLEVEVSIPKSNLVILAYTAFLLEA